MIQQQWFDLPVLGERSPADIAIALNEIDDDEQESAPVAKGPRFPSFEKSPSRALFQRPSKPWLHTGHVFGFIAPDESEPFLPIRDLGAIRPDRRLRQARVKITLDRLHVANYPGRGIHRVLLHFFAQHQTAAQALDLHVNATYRATDGSHAAVRGYPLFVGLGVGLEGLRLKCRTINVGNEHDFAFFSMLESDVFKSGLKLVSTMQPTIGPFSELAFGVAKAIASRHNNISVQDVDLGLDFGNSPAGARLAEGSYLVAQVPEHIETRRFWDTWGFYPASGQVLHRKEDGIDFGYNYLIFSISRCQHDEEDRSHG